MKLHLFQCINLRGNHREQFVPGLAPSAWSLSRAKLALRTVSANIPEIERQIALKEMANITMFSSLVGHSPEGDPQYTS